MVQGFTIYKQDNSGIEIKVYDLTFQLQVVVSRKVENTYFQIGHFTLSKIPGKTLKEHRDKVLAETEAKFPAIF